MSTPSALPAEAEHQAALAAPAGGKPSFWASPAVKTLLSIAVGLILWAIIPAGDDLTEIGVRFIAILTASMVMWIAVGTDWTALLFLGLLVIGGILTPAQVWAGSIGNPIVILVLVYTMLAVCLSRNGVIDAMTAWFISRPFVKGRPYAFMAMLFAANFALGIIMHNFAIFVVFLNITIRLCKALGIEKGHSLYILLMLGNLWVDGVINWASPIAKTIPNVIIGLLEEQLGVTITYMQWLAVGLPFMVVMLGVILLTIRILNPDVSSLRDLDVDAFVANTPKMNARGWIAVAAVTLVVAITVIPEIFLTLGLFTGVSAWIMDLGIAVPAIVAIAVLALTKVKGQAVLDAPATFKEVPLSMLVFVGAIMVMGGPLNSPDTGVIAWLSNMLDPIFGGMAPLLIITFAVVGSIALTNFISNTVAAILFLNLGIAIFLGMGGISTPLIIGFAIALALASSLAVLTPSATIVTPMIFDGGHITMGNSFKYNMLFVALTFVVVVAFVPLISWMMPMLGA